MATDKYEIEIDYTKLNEAMEELTEAFEEFNRAWNTLPWIVRVATRLQLFYENDIMEIRERFMKRIVNDVLQFRRKNVQKD